MAVYCVVLLSIWQENVSYFAIWGTRNGEGLGLDGGGVVGCGEAKGWEGAGCGL